MKTFFQYFLTFTLLFPALSWGQKHTLSGFIRDAVSGEALIAATVAVPRAGIGATTNSYGFYSLTLPAQDTIEVVITYVGYQVAGKKVPFQQSVKLDVDLTPTPITLDEVVITDNKTRQNVEAAQMGVIDLPIQQIQLLPYIAGEKDILKAIQYLPGVQSGNEGSAGFFVRGGKPDQNLIQMDEAVVYNPFHLMGYTSIFNSDAISDLTLYKGSFPAQYGGRLSSILDVRMKEGNNKEWKADIGVGLISSKFTVEGPLKKETSSIMVSYRRFYWDLLIRPFVSLAQKGSRLGYNFQDLNAKVNYQLGKKDRIYVSGYLGNDLLYQEFKYPTTINTYTIPDPNNPGGVIVVTDTIPGDTTLFNTGWGNKTLSARWNHLFSDRLFANTTATMSSYSAYVVNQQGNQALTTRSSIQDVGVKTDFDFFPSPRHKIKFGYNYLYHTFTPSSVKGRVADTVFNSLRRQYVTEGALYINDEWAANERFVINAGLRAPFFYDGKTPYINIEPRLTANLILSKNSSIKAGYTMMNQYLHLLTSSTIGIPLLDLWVPSSATIKPEVAHQGAVGFFQNFLNDAYESSVELYYKQMSNQIDFKEGANFFFNSNYEKEIVYGKGWSYGAEFFVRKRAGRFNGWVGYTLSWTWRQFDSLNMGKPFFFKYDRRHDIDIVAMYKFSNAWSFSSVFTYGTGNAATMPQGVFSVYNPAEQQGNWWGGYNAYDYGAKNSFRMPAYHRMDIGLHHQKVFEKYTREIHIDIYNVYNRRNPYFLRLGQVTDPRSLGRLKVIRQISLLPVIPSIMFQWKF